MSERRYDEREVAEILERATAADAVPATASGASPTGMTLSELQDIGAEVGIPPERIAEAARAIAIQADAPPTRTFLGAPRSVAHIVPIDRPLTEDEWTRLVVALRETFRAEGRIRVHGDLRSWRNGNLQVHVEPAGEGYRVRMQTVKGNAAQLAGLGAGALVLGTLGILDGDAGGMRAAMLMGAAGVGLIGFVRATLPRWARERATQMTLLAERIRQLVR